MKAGQILQGKTSHQIQLKMALVSYLSIQLNMFYIANNRLILNAIKTHSLQFA